MGVFSLQVYKAVSITNSNGNKKLIKDDYYKNMTQDIPTNGNSSTACFNTNNDSTKNGHYTLDIVDTSSDNASEYIYPTFISASIHEKDYHNLCNGHSIKLNVGK